MLNRLVKVHVHSHMHVRFMSHPRSDEALVCTWQCGTSMADNTSSGVVTNAAHTAYMYSHMQSHVTSVWKGCRHSCTFSLLVIILFYFPPPKLAVSQTVVPNESTGQEEWESEGGGTEGSAMKSGRVREEGQRGPL